MRQDHSLTVASLLATLLITIHVAQDAVHAADGMPMGEVTALILIALVMAYGTLALAGRRAGYLIMLLGGLLAAAMPFIHGAGERTTRWGLFFVWTLFALGVTGLLTAALAVRGFWQTARGGERTS